MEPKRWSKREKEQLLQKLAHLYPEALTRRTELTYLTPYQLIVAVILSAQCTDDRVNMVTPSLFAKYPDFAALAAAAEGDIEQYIKSCGLYHAKAKNLKAMAMAVCARGGNLPQAVEELVQLPGVGRKTANVVLAVLWDIPALAVDTHVGRVASRLGLASIGSAEKIEREVTAKFPKNKWNLIHRLFILHGRNICAARKPLCQKCPLAAMCNYNFALPIKCATLN